MVQPEIVDAIYEAAFVPEQWPTVLQSVANQHAANSAAMLVIDRRIPPIFTCTENISQALADFAQSPSWYENPRLKRLRRFDHHGFMRIQDFSTDEELQADYAPEIRASRDIAWQVGTTFTMPTGELVLFTFERRPGSDNFEPEIIASLDTLRAHLARASLAATRFQLQQAANTVAAFGMLNLPAAVVSAKGNLLAANEQFTHHDDIIRIRAFDRLRVPDPQIDILFQDALNDGNAAPLVRTIPFPARLPNTPPGLIHVMPISRNARDVFANGAHIVVLSIYDAGGTVPDGAILRGLFDLTSAEARLASALASGLTLAEAASAGGVSITTARSHLAQVFRKTATRQQSELVALLKGARLAP